MRYPQCLKLSTVLLFLSMVFPSKIHLDQGGSLALIILQNGGTDFVTIKSIVGRYFETQYGTFQLNAHMRYSWEKKSLYFYYQGSPNPIDIQSAVAILEYLQSVDDPVLRVADLDTETARNALGYQALQFLEAFKQTDEEGIEHAFDIPLRTDKKLKPSASLAGLPSPLPPNVGLYVTEDRKIKKLKLTIKRDGDKATATASVRKQNLSFDVSDKKARYSHGKSSLYVFFEGYNKPVYLNVDSYLRAFIPYEPITVMDTEQDIRHTHKVVQLATKKVEKKPFNIMYALIAIIGFVIVYQVVINPYIAHEQTKADLERINQNKLDVQDRQLEQQRLELEKLRLQNPEAPVVGER